MNSSGMRLLVSFLPTRKTALFSSLNRQVATNLLSFLSCDFIVFLYKVFKFYSFTLCYRQQTNRINIFLNVSIGTALFFVEWLQIHWFREMENKRHSKISCHTSVASLLDSFLIMIRFNGDWRLLKLLLGPLW